MTIGLSFFYQPPIYERFIRIITAELVSGLCAVVKEYQRGGRTGLVVRASDSGSGDPGSILSRVGVLFP